MKPMIDIHNYEAYYLDYLEGNLDVATSELLELFLAEHPELTIDGELPQLEPDMRIDASFKSSLKKEAAEEITAENLDYFLIAELEKQLSSGQQLQLNTFLARHPELEKERRIVQSLVLEAGNEEYAHKESLKKGGRIIPLWVKVAAAAAVLLLFTLPFLRLGTSEAGLNPQSQTAQAGNQPAGKAPAARLPDNKEQLSPQPVQSQQHEYMVKHTAAPDTHSEAKKEKPTNGSTPKQQQKHPSAVSELPARDIRSTAPDLAVSHPEKETSPTVAVASVAHEDSRMENTLPAITRGVSEVFKTPVEVKTEKSAGKKGKGFYIRVGNVEVSRSASL